MPPNRILLDSAPETPAEYWGVMEEGDGCAREVTPRLDMTRDEAVGWAAAKEAFEKNGKTYRVARRKGRKP